MMIIYGLFEYSYDWYEWEEFKMASKKTDKLQKLATSPYSIIYTEEDHRAFAKEQVNHYYIKQLDFV